MSARIAFAMVAIGATAAAVIAGTAIVVLPEDTDVALPIATQAQAPPLGPMLPSATDLGRLTNRPMKMRFEMDALGPPPGPDYATQPAGCGSLALPMEATSYNNVSWLEAQRVSYLPVDDSPLRQLRVNAGIVRMASDDVATKFLKDIGDQWSKCNLVSFRFGTASPSDFTVRDVHVMPDRVDAMWVQNNVAEFSCQHVMAAKGTYVIDAHSCGKPPVDTQKWTDAILASVPD